MYVHVLLVCIHVCACIISCTAHCYVCVYITSSFRKASAWEGSKVIVVFKHCTSSPPLSAKGRTTTEIQLGLTKAVFTTKIPPARNTKRPTDTSEETVGACCSDEHEDTPPREGSASRESTPSAPSTPVKHATTTYHSKMEAPLSRSTAASPTPGKKRVIPAPTNKIPVPKSAVPKSKIPKPQ